MRYCFVGKTFVVCLSTTKTTKILHPEKYLLYSIIALPVRIVLEVYSNNYAVIYCLYMYLNVYIHVMYCLCSSIFSV